MSESNSIPPNKHPEQQQGEAIKKLDMKAITKILKTPSESRTQKQCAELLDQIGNLEFFKRYTENPQSANVPKLCCKYMEIELAEQNQDIFEFGSVGNKFYIVLQGLVGVWVPKPKPEVEEKTKNSEPNFFNDFMKVKTINEGNAFGELALLNNKPRLATIRTEIQTHLATLSKENFNKILKEHEEQKLREEINFLQGVPAFSDLNLKQLRFLYLNSKVINTQKNEIIFDEKDECDGLYIIRTGEFEIYKTAEKQLDQKEEQMKQNILSFSSLNKHSSSKLPKYIKIKVLTSGEMVGEELLLKQKYRKIRLVCLSQNGVILKVKESEFLRRLNEDPYIQKAFLKRLRKLSADNDERIQRQVQQFMEFKHFLLEDRVPVKIRQSIDKMYSNPHLSEEQKQTNITEFRQQFMVVDEMMRKSELQSAILSQAALAYKFQSMHSTMFQNQIQYLNYKRLSVIANEPNSISSPTTQTALPFPSRSSFILSKPPIDFNNNNNNTQAQSMVSIAEQETVESSREKLFQLATVTPIQELKNSSPKVILEDNENENEKEGDNTNKASIKIPLHFFGKAGGANKQQQHTNRKSVLTQQSFSEISSAVITGPKSITQINEIDDTIEFIPPHKRMSITLKDAKSPLSDKFQEGTFFQHSSGNRNSISGAAQTQQHYGFSQSMADVLLNHNNNNNTSITNNNATAHTNSSYDCLPQPFIFGNESKKRNHHYHSSSLIKENYIRDWKKSKNNNNNSKAVEGQTSEKSAADAQKMALLNRIKKITSQSSVSNGYLKNDDQNGIIIHNIQPNLESSTPMNRPRPYHFDGATPKNVGSLHGIVTLPKLQESPPSIPLTEAEPRKRFSRGLAIPNSASTISLSIGAKPAFLHKDRIYKKKSLLY